MGQRNLTPDLATSRLVHWTRQITLIPFLILGFLLGGSDLTFAQNRLELAYEDYKEETADFLEKLDSLHQRAKEVGDQDLANRIEKKADLLTGDDSKLPPLPREMQGEISHDLPSRQRAVHVEFQHECEQYAQNLYLIARRSQSSGPVFAFELINLLLRFDPDHTSARQMRGYVRHDGKWMTPFERDKQRSGEVDHPRFGWIKERYVDHYEDGERNYRGNWISAEKEALIRQDFRRGWDIETEHFQIRTNVGLEEGVELGRKLETFYDYFITTFSPFYNSPEQMRRLFDSTTGRSKTRTQRYEVHYFRNKEEYVDRLVSRVPQIAVTNGLYQLQDRTCYFYYDPAANNDATIFHEVTHQLMYESHLDERDIGREGHFWIVEGIACYMESFEVTETPEGFDYSVGNPQFIRFYWARHRLLKEDFYVPLETFTRFGMVPYQTGNTEVLQKRYSQASGLAHFFMHYDEGRYRNALMLYLAQIYHSNPTVQNNIQGLDELTGVPYAKLDRQYREYIQNQEEEVGQKPVIQ